MHVPSSINYVIHILTISQKDYNRLSANDKLKTLKEQKQTQKFCYSTQVHCRELEDARFHALGFKDLDRRVSQVVMNRKGVFEE